MNGWSMARKKKKLRCEKREKPLYSIHMCLLHLQIAITLGISSHTQTHRPSIFIICANLSIDLPPLAVSYFHSLHIWQSEKRYVCMHDRRANTLARSKNDITFQNVPQTMRRACFFLQISLLYIFLSSRKNVPRNRNERLRRRAKKRNPVITCVHWMHN